MYTLAYHPYPTERQQEEKTLEKEDLEVFREMAETFIKPLTCKHLSGNLATVIGHCAKQTLPSIHPLWGLAKHD